MAVKLNLPDIASGAMYTHAFLWYKQDANGVSTPVDLTGYEAALQIWVDGAQNAAASWGTTTGEITLETNRISIEAVASKTSGLTFEGAQYDLLVWPTVDPDRVVRVAYGEVNAYPVLTQLA